MEINKTMPSELTEISVQPWCQSMIDRAFSSNDKLLTIQDFVKVVNFGIDAFMVDKCFLNLRDDMPVYIDTDMIEWMGYSGKSDKRKEKFTAILERNFKKDIDYHVYNNNDYQQWLDTNEDSYPPHVGRITYPPITTGRGSYQTKHLIMPSSSFKKVLMMLNTAKANEIREYYIALESLIKVYMTYQSLFRHREACSAMTEKDNSIKYLITMVEENARMALEGREKHSADIQQLLGFGEKTNNLLSSANQKLDVVKNNNEELVNTVDDLHVIVEDMEKTVIKLDTRLDVVLPNRVLIENIKPGNQPVIVLIKDTAAIAGEFDLYVMRCQEKTVNPAMRRLKNKFGDGLVFVKRIKQPNAIAFWETIKENHKYNIIWSSDNWFRLISITHDKFFEHIEVLDKKRQEK
jgi:hypothetical protein